MKPHDPLPPPATNHMKGKPMMSKEAIVRTKAGREIRVGRVNDTVVMWIGVLGMETVGRDYVLDPTNANRLCRAIRKAALEAEEGKVKAE